MGTPRLLVPSFYDIACVITPITNPTSCAYARARTSSTRRGSDMGTPRQLVPSLKFFSISWRTYL